MKILGMSVFFVSFLISTIVCLMVAKWKENKWLGLGIGTFIQSLLLCSAAVIFAKVAPQTFLKPAEGLFASLGIFVFPFFIPIFLCLQFYILEYLRKNIWNT
ncbi:hypothetical protein [Alkalihalobacillus trypoxylicola]|uniref:Uncharacterized protein n=1 Tax=Alkalihalobacillus trypoxylicola TaxID=519424 RepID=A0A161QIT1_9BACI|nr:hypothetical protein [Alkalihalobacillus trypoxylicola]KYG29438.1 hypothetical protein AZF04_07910 [Alkalihalobacillus trypoxylicola]